MENQNELVTKKKVNVIIVIIVILLILILALSGYIYYDKFLSNNSGNKQTEKNKKYNDDNVQDSKDFEEKENNDNNIIDNSENLDINELASTLHSSVQKDGITTFISSCHSKSVSSGQPPESEYKNTEVSINTIDIVIEKLKTATVVDKNITFSWFGCPPKSVTYYVSVNSNDQSEVRKQKIFSLNYADGKDMLLVGYNNEGYAFHFNSSDEISNFIENLK